MEHLAVQDAPFSLHNWAVGGQSVPLERRPFPARRAKASGAGRAFFPFLAVVTLSACQGAGTNTVATRSSAAVGQAITAGATAFTVLAGTSPGFADGKSGASQFREPNGIDIDAMGNIFIADTGNHRIRKVTPTGVVTTIAGSEKGFKDGLGKDARFHSPYGLAIRRDGTIFVADTKNHRIRTIAPDNTVSTIAGSADPGTRDGTPGDSRFNLPLSLALDALDGIVVADTGNHRIRRIDLSGTVTTLAGQEPGYMDGLATEARFDAPSDIGLDARGRIYVADLRNHAIRELDPITGQVRTLAGNGKSGAVDGDANTARLNLPTGLAVTSSGTIYVADSQNRALRVVSPGGYVTTLSQSAEGVKAPAFTPLDLVVDPQGGLIVTDAGRGLVLKSK